MTAAAKRGTEERAELVEIDASHDLRQTRARQEFAAWREAHPDFTSKELLDEWARIRRAWNLGQKG